MRYTAGHLTSAAEMLMTGTKSQKKRIAAQLDAAMLLRFGSDWGDEVRMLREQIATLLAERAASVGNEKDAERWRKLKRIMESAKGGASLEINQEFAYYEKPEPGSEVQLQWYPDTPIGFYKVNASSLDEAIDGAEE